MRIYVGILAAVILLIATNAALIGLSRLTYSMGQHRQLPEGLRKIHPTLRTPYVAILVFSGVAILTVLPGETSFLATLYSFGAMLSFTIAHASVIRLRQKDPDSARRTWIPPVGNLKLGGVSIPLTAVLGGFGTLGAFVVVGALDPVTLAAGGGWMVLGLAGYLLYRRFQGLPATKTVKVVLPEALGVEEVEYRSVLVPIEDDAPFSEETLGTAVRLASKRRRGIHVVSVLTVPTHLPLDAPLRDQEREAQQKIEQAKLIGGLRVSGHVHRVRPNQAGHSIAEEAEELKATRDRDRAALPQRRAALRQDAADRPRRAAVPRDRGRRAHRRPRGHGDRRRQRAARADAVAMSGVRSLGGLRPARAINWRRGHSRS